MTPDPWGATLAGILTLAIMSFLIKDNRFYKFAEHLFVGIAAGYYVALQFRTVFVPNLWAPLTGAEPGTTSFNIFGGDPWFFIPFVLAALLFTRLLPSGQWLSRWSIGVMVGAYAGLQLIGFAQGDLIAQVQANLLSVNTGSTGTNINNLLLIVGVLTTLIYFFFSTEHKGTVGVLSKIGIYFLMISFGASYGFTVMARISLLIGRLEFLFTTWPNALGIGG